MSALPGTTSDWFGYERHDFAVAGVPALVVRPKTPRAAAEGFSRGGE